MDYLPRFFELVLVILFAVVAMTLFYKLLPFRAWKNNKPLLVLFPKYVASFTRPANEIKQTLEALKFIRESPAVYTRGKIYGNFSAKAVKLRVEVDEARREVRVAAEFLGILFDAGGVWKLTSQIVKGVA